MDNRTLHVPVSLLLDPAQTASDKVLTIALRLNPTATLTQLQGRSGLSRSTVLIGKARVSGNRTFGGPRVKIPGALLADRTVGAQSKVVYGLLQTTPEFREHRGQFTFTALSCQTHLSCNTLKRAVRELIGAGWMQTTQANRRRPVHFSLGSPEQRRSLAEAALVRRRLKRAKHGGEAIMQEYLSLLIDSDQFTDNARPGFLVSPLTGERLELDRFYPPNVAFEFHGAQHHGQTGRFSQAEADAQHLRDIMKAGICLYQGIHLVITHAADLSLQGMTKKIGQSMPLRNLSGHEPLIDVLEDASLTYWAHAAR